MKITFVLPQVGFAGGIRVVAIYAERLKKRGHQVAVISTPPQKPSLNQQVKSVLKGRGLIAYEKHLPSYFDSIDVPHTVLEHEGPITDADVPDADVVVATWWETAEWVASLSQSKGAKVYFIQHYEKFDYLPAERVSATWSLPMHKIAVAQWLVDIARNQYGDKKVSLVPCSVDLDQFCAPKRDKQPNPVFGVMYSPIYWKGCDISLKAFSLAKERIPNLRLVAFGTDDPSPDLPLPPDTEYVCKPPQHLLKDLYAKCDAWLFGSRLEGFGLPILEAMACRTPVIGTPVGAAPELLSNGAGILVNPEDPEDMARAIEQVVQLSDTQWQAMSNAAYAKATGYTWDDATDLFEAAFYKAIQRSESNDFTTPSMMDIKLVGAGPLCS